MRKCRQQKALKVLLMYLYVTLLIKKIPGSNNRHFVFNNTKRKYRAVFDGKCMLHFWANWKSILRKRLSQDALPKFHLNKYESYFKYIVLLSDGISLNAGKNTPKTNYMIWNFLVPTTLVFLPSKWKISLILYLRLAMARGAYFKNEACT